jgi:hypothetical protein
MAYLADVQPDGHTAYDRASPWVLGEEFPMRLEDTPRTARVVRVYGDGLVVAWVEGDRPELLDEFLDQLDYAVTHVRELAMPLMRYVFVPRRPVTSTGSGQYLILVMATDQWRGIALSAVRADVMLTTIALAIDTSPGAPSLASLLDGNYDWLNPDPTPVAEFYARRAQPGDGDFIAGYDSTMGFLRDLVIRRVRAGEPVDDAVRAVSRGAIEGWYGYDRYGARRAGLTSRMRERLGSEWQPELALLDWTLSHAADDLTGDPALQDHASLRIWDIPAAMPFAWRPAGVLSPSSPVVSFERGGGSPDYLYLRDGGEGLAFTVASDVSRMQWKLIRFR